MSNVSAFPTTGRGDPGLATPPSSLSAAAARHWPEVVGALTLAGTGSRIDRDLIAMYCEVFARWRDATAHVAADGLMVRPCEECAPVENPFLAIAERSGEQLRRIGASLGLAPDARHRMGVTVTPAGALSALGRQLGASK